MPMSHRLLLLTLPCAMALAQERQPGQGVNFYSAEKEAALGKQIASEVLRSNQVLDNESVRTYVRELGEKLAARVSEPRPTFTFNVIVNAAPRKLHEPVALPGGFVFVRTGLFTVARDEAEFASMLTHAIAHVVERHGTRIATRAQITNIASIPLIWVDLSDSLPVGFLPFARAHEMEADKLAVQLMAGAGYDPAALIRYIDRTQTDPSEQQRVYSPLPSRQQRLSA